MPPSADSVSELSALLHGLRYRGLAVGPDDAARLATVFQHAADWSHQRRVRVLKSLLARSDEERVLIEQLAPLLFVNAGKQSRTSEDTGLQPQPSREHSQHQQADRIFARVETTSEEQQDPQTTISWTLKKSAKLWLRKHWVWFVVVGVGLSLAVWQPWLLISTPYIAEEETLTPEEETPTPEDFPPKAPKPPDPGQEPDVPDLPQPPVWILWTSLGVSCVLAAGFWVPWLRFYRQTLKLRDMQYSTGSRSYQLGVFSDRSAVPLDPNVVREAAFHLSAASAYAPAPWLDIQQTVEATAQNAGQLTLRFDTWFEHRPVLFIEDIAPSMARWPQFGQQIGTALSRQGGRVTWYYMDRTPAVLSPDRDMHTRFSLEQVLANLSEPAVIVLSDASALDGIVASTTPDWLGGLTHAVWLHPRQPDFWGVGVQWLAERLQVVPLSDEGLLRLGSPAAGSNNGLARRWRPARCVGYQPEMRLASLRMELGERTFWWCAAGAVLDRFGALTSQLWWLLRTDVFEASGYGAVPRERIERVWELPEVRVGADGTVRLEDTLRDSLIATLQDERPQLLSAVVTWAEALILIDLGQLAPRSVAAVEARAMQTRLQLLDPERQAEARLSLQQLAREGLGEWVELEPTELGVLRRLRVKLQPVKKPGQTGLVVGLAGVIGALVSIGLLQNPDLLFPPPEIGPIALQVPENSDAAPIPAGPMVQIPAGEFWMGCNDKVDAQCSDDEKPGRTVYVDAFQVDITEVTVKAYRSCVESGKCSPSIKDDSCNWNKQGRDDHPINCATWDQARTYCEAVGKRLPTEAEWEKASRGEKGLTYPWGNEWDKTKANTSERGKGGTVAVASYASGVSRYGVYHMSGNVLEWVQDWYAADYYQKGPDRNPTGPTSGKYRSVRGGSWARYRGNARVAYRSWFTPGLVYDDLGFRCASS